MRTRGILVLILCLPIAVQAQGVGRYYDYSGTVTWKGRLNFAGSTLTGYTADSVVVTVVKDKATCSGTWIHDTKSPGGAVHKETGTISGSGLIKIVVQPDHVTPGAGTFQIVVSCPTPKTATSPSTPADLDGGQVIGGHELPSIPNLAILSGSDTMPHAETDSVNGATGTFIINWHLTTTSKPDDWTTGPKDATTQRRKEL